MGAGRRPLGRPIGRQADRQTNDIYLLRQPARRADGRTPRATIGLHRCVLTDVARMDAPERVGPVYVSLA